MLLKGKEEGICRFHIPYLPLGAFYGTGLAAAPEKRSQASLCLTIRQGGGETDGSSAIRTAGIPDMRSCLSSVRTEAGCPGDPAGRLPARAGTSRNRNVRTVPAGCCVRLFGKRKPCSSNRCIVNRIHLFGARLLSVESYRTIASCFYV